MIMNDDPGKAQPVPPRNSPAIQVRSFLRRGHKVTFAKRGKSGKAAVLQGLRGGGRSLRDGEVNAHTKTDPIFGHGFQLLKQQQRMTMSLQKVGASKSAGRKIGWSKERVEVLKAALGTSVVEKGGGEWWGWWGKGRKKCRRGIKIWQCSRYVHIHPPAIYTSEHSAMDVHEDFLQPGTRPPYFMARYPSGYI
ncbi:hypothetical protein B0H19DRAFT_1083571 [Mycena capillaripes]|nr:hypothetical protein B0H19DRAFT_1083571 [Mycena capillaripes]